MQIRIGGGGRVFTTRVHTRRHTTLLSERGAFTDGLCAASLSRKARRKTQLADKIISLPKGILLTFFRLSRGPDLTCVGTILQQIFLGVFLGGTAESPARPACYSSTLKLDGAKNNGTRPRRHKNSRSGLGRTQGRNRAPCHRRHLPRYCGGTHRRNPASHAYVKSMIATYNWSLPDERIQ